MSVPGRDFLKHAATYGMANLLLQAGHLVLLPVYTRCLSPADYGVLEILGRIAETVSTFLFVGGLRQALFTFYQQSPQPGDRARVVSSTLTLLCFFCAVGGGFVFLWAQPLSYWLGLADQAAGTNLFRLALLGILLEPFTLIPLALIQSRVESLTYVAVTLSQFLLRVTLCILLVAYFGLGVWGVLMATAVTTGIYAVALSCRELVAAAAWPDWGKSVALLRFALPFLPGGICFFVLHHGDRFFLIHWHGEETVGIYALGYKLAMVVTTFSLNPLYMVWSVHMYAVARTPQAPTAFGIVFTRIMAAYLLAGLGVGLFAEDIVTILCGDRYTGAAVVVAPVLLACGFQCSASLMDAGFYLRRRTGLKLGISLSSTAVMLVLYVALIPPLGGIGAALATLFGFAFHAGFTWLMTQQFFPVRYEWNRLLVMLFLATALWGASRCLPEAFWAWPIKAGLWGLWPLLLWQAGLISAVEKQYARTFVGQILVCLSASSVRLREVRRRVFAPQRVPLLAAETEDALAPPGEAPEDAAA